ncbi:hypothetical protein LA080_008641 [Diaporthe eres]|nr:hypothetical protein LA080_008641 [Diaporthe eres]
MSVDSLGNSPFLGHVRRDPKPTGSESHGTAQIATSDGWRELKQDIGPVYPRSDEVSAWASGDKSKLQTTAARNDPRLEHAEWIGIKGFATTPITDKPLGGWAQEGMSLNPALDVAGSPPLIPAAAMWHYKVGHRYYRVGHPALSNSPQALHGMNEATQQQRQPYHHT